MDICSYLNEKGVFYTTQEHSPAYTAQEVAAETHIRGQKIAKPVIVADEEGYVMCVIPANQRLDLNKVAMLRGTYDLRLALEEEMCELFQDSEIGAEPPFGNLYEMPTLVDSHLTQDDEIAFEAGTHHTVVIMSYDDFEYLTHPAVADLTMHVGTV